MYEKMYKKQTYRAVLVALKIQNLKINNLIAKLRPGTNFKSVLNPNLIAIPNSKLRLKNTS